MFSNRSAAVVFPFIVDDGADAFLSLYAMAHRSSLNILTEGFMTSAPLVRNTPRILNFSASCFPVWLAESYLLLFQRISSGAGVGIWRLGRNLYQASVRNSERDGVGQQECWPIGCLQDSVSWQIGPAEVIPRRWRSTRHRQLHRHHKRRQLVPA